MKYEEIQVKIPTDWKDISISMFQDFKTIEKTEYNNEEEKAIDFICAMTKIKPEQLVRFKYKDLKYLSNKLTNLMSSSFDDKTLIKKVDFNGVKYGFIPNLSSISLGEFVDIEEYCKKPYDNLHKIMSVLYRPIIKERGERYNIEEYKPDEFEQDKFKDFPIIESVSALSFFFRLGKQLKLALLKYSTRKVEKKIAKLKSFQRSGVGII